MATQGTQLPIYINTHFFCIFQNVSKKIFEKKKNLKLKTNKQKQANNYKA